LKEETRVIRYREFLRANTPAMGIKRKKLRIGKKIPLSSTNQTTAFINKVELYDKYQLYCVDYFNICLYISGKHIKTHYYSDSQSGQALPYALNTY
jgi:hypothetical protein